MLAGERQIVFVTGEAGIGKTALVDTFVRGIVSAGNVRIGRGQCLEHYGTSEAFLPVLEAIGRLAREQKRIVEVLQSHAPMWLLQMPSLVSASDRELLSRELQGVSRERMLREMGDALEVLTGELPLVLILEDLHWSDYSTLDLISYLAKKRQLAHLMVIVTYRPADLIISGHPLHAVKRELLAAGQCEELPLDYLNEEAVAKYLAVRFPENRFPAKLVSLIHQRTEGNPLFMVNAVEWLISEECIAERDGTWVMVEDIENVVVGVPDSIRQIIERQIEYLDADDQRTLEAASVAGSDFSPLAVVAALEESRASVQMRCDELARQRQFIQDSGVQMLPNGEAISRYGFIHSLYQNVLYDRVSPARRVQLHRRIGEAGELVYGERVGEIAAELAMHFERGANHPRAVMYLQTAAENAIRRFAYREAVLLSRRGLEVLASLPDTPERARQELCFHLTLGMPLIATEGYAAPDVGSTYLRAREICDRLGETPEISQTLWGVWTFYLVRAELGTARRVAEEFLRRAPGLLYPRLSMEITLMHLGEFRPALDYFKEAIALYDPVRHRDDAFRYSQNPAIGSRCHAAWTLWFLGEPDQALAMVHEAQQLARELAEPHGLAHTLFFAAIVHQLRGESRMAKKQAAAAVAISLEHGLALYYATATVTLGWGLIEEGWHQLAIENIRQGLDAHQATGTVLLLPHFLALMAEALGADGQTKEALRVLDEALEIAERTGERYYDAELHRLKGELQLTASTAQREACFNRALELARSQNAKSLELRAALSLARLYQSQGKHREAGSLLAPIYDRFTEGFDTADLHAAKDLLNEFEEPRSGEILPAPGASRGNTSAKVQSP
jgi:predicted ATPase